MNFTQQEIQLLKKLNKMSNLELSAFCKSLPESELDNIADLVFVAALSLAVGDDEWVTEDMQADAEATYLKNATEEQLIKSMDQPVDSFREANEILTKFKL